MSEQSGLVAAFVELEHQLVASLRHGRASFAHYGLRGDQAESAFREFLQKHLPRFLTVGTGEVLDRTGGRSGQIDVVIANEDQPFIGGLNEPSLYLIEGVAAVAEVKSRLTTDRLRDSIANATAFKQLRNTHIVGDTISANESDIKRFYTTPPYFLVAYENEVNEASLIERLAKSKPIRSAQGEEPALDPFDAVFVLGHGAAINYGDGNGSYQFRFRNSPDDHSATGWVWHPTDSVLVDLMLWLSITMPRVRRFDSIASEYLMDAAGQRRDGLYNERGSRNSRQWTND